MQRAARAIAMVATAAIAVPAARASTTSTPRRTRSRRGRSILRPMLRELRLSVLVAGVLAAGCAREQPTAAPHGSLLVDAGDSTFWVRSDDGSIHVRRSGLLLARLDGRFHEVYVTDDDRSYYDAVIVGQRIFRRDLVTGDSTLLFEDPSIAGIANAYGAAHPDEQPLGPDEDASDDPATTATTETELLDVLGSLLNVERHVDFDLASGREVHLTRREVIDLRSGKPVDVRDIVAEGTAADVMGKARLAMVAVRDSVRQSRDERARAAAAALGGFRFDSTSFSVAVVDGTPSIAFVVPGRGQRAAGYTLPLPPIAVAPGAWWTEARTSLPSVQSDSIDAWRGDGYDVVARYIGGDDGADFALRDSTGREWAVGRLPTPVMRVYRLDALLGDSTTVQAITRAFDEAEESTADTRTASVTRSPLTVPASLHAPRQP